MDPKRRYEFRMNAIGKLELLSLTQFNSLIMIQLYKINTVFK
jgi:hypothetical protein